MARVYPFRAWMYDPAQVGDLSTVLTQPYDKITAEMQERYYAAGEFNLARIIRGKTFPTDTAEANVYTRAHEAFQDWIHRGILRRLDAPAFFAYFQEFEAPDSPGIRRVRQGLIGLGKLEDYSSGIVFPHEHTLSAPKEDRLNLLRRTRAHFGQIFMLYSDPTRAVDRLLREKSESAPPRVRVVDEYGVVHSLWPIQDAPAIQAIQQAMRDQRLIIADGHHRYETALRFRDECRADAASSAGDLNAPDQVMMTFVNMDSEGLTVLPTHRLVDNLPDFDFKEFIVKAQQLFNLTGFKFFTLDEKQRKFREFLHELREVGAVIPTIGLRAAGTSNFYLMKLKGTLNLSQLLPEVSERQRALDVVILHKVILERCLGISAEDIRAEKNLRYVREAAEALAGVDHQEAQLCFFLNPTPISQVREIAIAGEQLPQKSTDFYPKMLSGLTIYPLDLT